MHGHRSNDLDTAAEHEHVFADDHSHAAAQVFASFDAGHIRAHQDHDGLDIDPPTKAFGKLTPAKLPVAMLVAFAFRALLAPLQARLAPILPPLRPPKPRPRSFLLPPSQAPPRAA